MPSSGHVDRIAVGPGGITLIDISSFCGPARIRNGRLIAAGGVDKTAAIDALLAQRRELEELLDPQETNEIQIKVALCWPHVEGSAHFGALSLKGARVDGPRGVARLARRSGELPPEGVQYARRHARHARWPKPPTDPDYGSSCLLGLALGRARPR